MMLQVVQQDNGACAASAHVNPLIRKLSHFILLSPPDQRVLDSISQGEERFPVDVDIVSEGMAPRSAFLLKEGLAIRYRAMPDGGRQIMTFLIPGDLCGTHVFLLKTMDHSIGTITPVRIAPISRERMMETFASYPRISAGLWWSSLQEEAMLRERIVSLGRRNAQGRIAYLLCELLWRHAAVSLTKGEVFHLPLTQRELGDTVGLSPVHVNHVLKEFREMGLISQDRRMIRLLDVTALQDIAAFNKDYLQLGGAPKELASYFDTLETKKFAAKCEDDGAWRPGDLRRRASGQSGDGCDA